MPTVALFVTCLGDQFAPHTVHATVRLLEAAGCQVEVPLDQTCCGQPGVTAGEPEAAALLAQHFVEVFESFDAIVAPSGSCASTVHHWYERLLDPLGDDWRTRAQSVAQHTYELTQYLVDVLGRTDLGAQVNRRVTVHDACHGLRNLGVRDQPRALLAAAGAELVEMHEPETCCGFGGSFSLEYSAVAAHLADDKLAMSAGTDASCVVMCDTACLLHLRGRRERTGAGPTPLHIADVLAAGLDADQS
ncbi:MAG: (Fe-S)-binding protein [Acidimicrobiia bacterium]